MEPLLGQFFSWSGNRDVWKVSVHARYERQRGPGSPAKCFIHEEHEGHEWERGKSIGADHPIQTFFDPAECPIHRKEGGRPG